MQISSLRKELAGRLAQFLWSQWAQMGVLAASPQRDDWVADPEALLLLSFEVGREDPRLFEEVLDWLDLNERLISVQRLRNLAIDEADRALVEAVLGWLGQGRRRPRLAAKSTPAETAEPPSPFFRRASVPVAEPDPAFLAQGFLLSRPRPSSNSQAPDLRAPLNFAFRLRALLGIGARAEVARVLLTSRLARTTDGDLAAATAYTKRNVHEARNALQAAGAFGFEGRGELFEAPGERWRMFLQLEELPRHVDWPQLFNAYRLLLRWLADPANEGLSGYMRASEARRLSEEIADDLRFAGAPIEVNGPTGAEYWNHFAAVVRQLSLPR